MRLLSLTTLYPNQAQPQHGVFVEQRLRHLRASGEIDLRVVAPVPWAPRLLSQTRKYAPFVRAPKQELRHGIPVLHPRYPLIPKIGMTVAPFLLAGAMKPVLNDIRRRGYEFDIIDAHYFYPDGVAAVMLAQHFRKPVLVTARGSDINWFPKYRLPRRMIRWTALNASGIISVCQALKDALVALGVPEHKIVVLRNGVDLQLFYPIDRKDERQRMQLRNTTLLSVGQLIERKGHDIVIKALVHLPQAELLIAGEGEEERSLKALAHSLCVEKRVRFLGAVRHEELRNYYGAADILVLASSREGWPNVILEALACGTPAVATKVWGTPEVIRSPDAGMLIEERSPVALARAVCTLLANYPDRLSTRRYAEQFSWEETTRGQITLFRKILQGPRASV